MRSKPRIHFVLAVLTGAFLTLGCAPRPPRDYRLVPGPGSKYSIEDGSVSLSTETIRLRITPFDDLARGAFIRARAEGASDPFAPGPAGLSRYLTFRLSVENIGPQDPIIFQPQNIYLASEMGERLYPLDFPEAYSRIFGATNSDPRLLNDLSKYLFDTGVSVAPGKRAEGLLIYPVGRSPAHKLRMEFSFLSTAGTPAQNYDIFFLQEARD